MTSRCEPIAAPVALQWGLADATAPAAELEKAVDDFIAPMLKQTSNALRGCKAQSLAARRGEPYERRRDIEQDFFVATWTHPTHWAAVDRILSRSGTS
jgi:enoyl-CoA hydratase/carnithine racemase